MDLKLYLKKLLEEALSLDLPQEEKQKYFCDKMNEFRQARKKKKK